MSAYSKFDDAFALPPEMEADFSLPDRPRPSTTNRALSPIQIDEEVTIKQKRKPAVKLIDRQSPQRKSLMCSLLSDRGLKHLRREAPSRLKFKGKGFEVSRTSRQENID